MALPRFCIAVAVMIIVFLAAGGVSGGRVDLNATALLRLPSEANSSNGEVDVCVGLTRPVSCPVTCFRTDPVCGTNGVTYWCGCADAVCGGAKVAKVGFCEVGSGGAGPQVLLLVHIVWLIVVGFSVLFGAL